MFQPSYREVFYEIRDSYVGQPGFYHAIVGTFDGCDRQIINAETFEEMTELIDIYLSRKQPSEVRQKTD